MSQGTTFFGGKLGELERRLWQAINERTPVQVDGSQITRTPRGFSIKNAAPPSSNFGLVAAKIYNEFEQYLVCYLDGGSPGDGTFDVLKPWGLRNGAILSDDIIGNDDGLVHTVTYQYTSIGVRAVLDDAANVSQQIVWPQYTPDRDVLYCARLKVPETFTPNGESDAKSFTLVDANLDGRRWEVYGNRYPLTLFGV